MTVREGRRSGSHKWQSCQESGNRNTAARKANASPAQAGLALNPNRLSQASCRSFDDLQGARNPIKSQKTCGACAFTGKRGSLAVIGSLILKE